MIMALFGINKKVSWKNPLCRNNDSEKENKEGFLLLLFNKEKKVQVHDILGCPWKFFFLFSPVYI